MAVWGVRKGPNRKKESRTKEGTNGTDPNGLPYVL